MNKKVIYTAIFGDYDELLEPKYIDNNIDYICFTNNLNIKSGKWRVVQITDFNGVTDNAKLNRIYKFMPHKFLSEYDESLYIDGNIKICGKSLSIAFNSALKESSISIPPHAERDCIYDEALICLEIGKGDPELIKKQIVFYQNEAYPVRYGLYENNVIFRKHNSAEIIKVMEQWYLMINKFSGRDQLSLCYLFWKYQVHCNRFSWGPKFSNKYFEIKFHNTEKKLPFLKKIVLYILLNSRRNWLYYFLGKTYKWYKK